MEPMKGVSLFQIEQGLADLLAYRQERMSDTEDPPQKDELDAIEGEIRKYQISAPAKVSGVVAIFRMWKSQIANAKEEITRLRNIVRVLEANEARLKEHVAAALELLPAPAKGKSRSLTGADGSKLILKGNGGVEPLQVDGWDAVREEWDVRQIPLPDEYQLAYLVVPRDLANRLMEEYDPIRIERVRPNGELIRKTLAEPCKSCHGLPLAGPSWSGLQPAEVKCDACNCTGKKLVPGARLLARGSHVEVK